MTVPEPTPMEHCERCGHTTPTPPLCADCADKENADG